LIPLSKIKKDHFLGFLVGVKRNREVLHLINFKNCTIKNQKTNVFFSLRLTLLGEKVEFSPSL